MNQYLKLLIIPLLLTFQSCISSTPDCDDINPQSIKWEFFTFENEKLYQEKLQLLDSLKFYWKEQGYESNSIIDQRNINHWGRVFDEIKNDSLGQLWDESVSRLDTICALNKEQLENTISNLKFLEDVRLIKESENSSLTAFHCYCQIKYELDGEIGEIEYKLTRRDFDSRTYSEATHSTLKYNSIITNQVWESLIK
ncbi:MAG: hypothetical protein OCD76_18330 [Reichenbachiella sp.]